MGQLTDLKAAIVAIEQAFVALDDVNAVAEVIAYPTMPTLRQPDAPCIYNVLGDSPAAYPDWGSVEDTIVIVPRLLVNVGDSEELEPMLDELSDLFLVYLDEQLRALPALLEATESIRRTARRPREVNYGETAYLAHEFPISARMRNRLVGPIRLRQP